MSGFDVQAGVLRAVGSEVTQMRPELGAASRDMADDTDAAYLAFQGWLTGAAVAGLLQTWEGDLENLGNHLGHLGDALGQCAANYQEDDAASATRFTRITR